MPPAVEVRPLRSAGHRPRVLRHPLAHERVHPGLRHRYFAVTDDDGRYQIDNVPPGTYTVVAWNEAMPSESRRVIVPTAAATSSCVPVREAMRILSSLTNRIFLGSALLAVLTIAIAIYLVNVAVTRRPRTSCGAASTRPARWSRSTATTLFDHFTREARLIADLPNLKAAVDTKDPADRRSRSRTIPAAASARDLLLVTDRPAGCWRRRPPAHAGRVRQRTRPIVTRRSSGHEVSLALAASRRHPAGRDRAELDRSRAAGDRSARSASASASTSSRREQFKALTNSEIAFGVDGAVQASTLPRSVTPHWPSGRRQRACSASTSATTTTSR